MAKQQPKYSAKEEEQLMTELWAPDIALNPYNFVMFNFPWGQKGTPLENFTGPRKWQRETLMNLTTHITKNRNLLNIDLDPKTWQSADASGRGIGKSSLVAWLILWMMTCNLGASVVVSANTETQLKTRTWAELGKWLTLSLNSHWFELQAMSLQPADWFGDLLKKDLKIDTKYYYAIAQLWSEENPDAFAGLHNHNGVMLVFDEASGIPKPIWTVSEGFFTEPVLHRYWFAFSNPRRPSGGFFECFHKLREFWRTRNIDSRTVEGTDKQVYEKIIKTYGPDSDEARVEVYGQFPKQGDNQFISRQVVEDSQNRELIADKTLPLIMGVDVARFGHDRSVIAFRRGRDARSIPMQVFKGYDNMKLAYTVAELIDKYDPDAVNIDGGAGSGVIDRLRELGYKINEVWFGAKSSTYEWYNVRTEIWAAMAGWLVGGCIAEDQELFDDLTGPEYDFYQNGDKRILEPKDKMKKRGLASPDKGDALAITFAVPVANRSLNTSRYSRQNSVAKDLDYDIFDD